MNLTISFKYMKKNIKSTINFNTKILKNKKVVANPVFLFLFFIYRRVIKKLKLNKINKKRT